MRYDLLLVNLYRDDRGISSGFLDPLGQYAIAAYLRKHHFLAQVFSGTVAQCRKAIRNEVRQGHVSIIGFYAAADTIRAVSHAIRWVKDTFPHVITFVGGPQAIALDLTFFETTGNDYSIIGEGEIPVHFLLSYLVDHVGSLNQIPSLVYLDSDTNQLVWNHCDEAVIQDLDELPWPRVEDSLTRRLRQGKMAGILTGRGCPNRCTFCYEGGNSKNVRFRSLDNVMAEIDYIHENNPDLEMLNIYDDTFTINPKRVLEFCSRVKDRNLQWVCEGHVSFVVNHPELIRTMVDSGLVAIQFGIESGSQIVLDAYNKRTSRDMILKAIQICKDAGVHSVTGNFIIGGAWETRDTLTESRNLAKDLIHSGKGILELFTVYFAPYPNTRMTNIPSDFGIKIDTTRQGWNLNTMHSAVVSTQDLSIPDLYEEKQRFDAFLAEQYMEASKTLRKADVIQGSFVNDKRVFLNERWEKIYQSMEHIQAFLYHLSEEEQTFHPDWYPIRTFEDYSLIDDIMSANVGSFSGLEKEFLLHATGIYTAKDISKISNVSIAIVQDIFENLNDRCLVYMSQW